MKTTSKKSTSRPSFTKTDHFLSTHELAQLLDVSDQQIRNLIRSGALTGIRVGKSAFRVEWAEFRRFVAEGGAR